MTNLIETIAELFSQNYSDLSEEDRWKGAFGYRKWQEILSAYRKGEPINWNSFCGVPEIFLAIRLPTIMQEGLSVMTCSLGDNSNERYIDIAHDHLVADHVCSTQKIMIGAALSPRLYREESPNPR